MTAVELPFAEEWNPYFVAYASSLGHAPADLSTETVGRNGYFIIWITARWREWGELHGIPYMEQGLYADEFGAWLAANYPEVTR